MTKDAHGLRDNRTCEHGTPMSRGEEEDVMRWKRWCPAQWVEKELNKHLTCIQYAALTLKETLTS